MITELGHFALILAAAIAVVQMIVPQVGAARGWSNWMAVGEPAALIQLVLVAFSFAALTYAFVVSDFSLRLVWLNSHSAMPMLYKVTGVWGNHEGSLLLWVLILALFGGAAAVWGAALAPTLRARVLSVQAAISVAFYAFILLTSNPFARIAVPPLNGRELNPILQDPGIAFHPPFLYLGYVGLSMTFSFAVAALLEGRVDAAWGRWVRPWTLAAWMFLTVGIALGSWWAYYELGWGGFWFWDPVENASFMPWLIATALLHCAVVVEKRETLKSWTILLAILAFGFSLMGTFIVRSGVLTSVHSFAEDPFTGSFILAILGVFMGGALVLFAARARVMEPLGVFALASRESALILNNILLAVSAVVVFVGTFWPILSELVLGRAVTVGAPFFDAAFTPFMVALAMVLPLGTLMPWKRARLGRYRASLALLALVAVAFAALGWAVQTQRSALGPLGLALAVWVLGGVVLDLRTRVNGDWSRLTRLPRADWGRALAHGGLGVTIFGVAAVLAWEVEDIRVAEVGDVIPLGRYEVTLAEVREGVEGPNFIAVEADFAVTRGGDPVTVLTAEQRRYPVSGTNTVEAAIANGITRDIYLVIGDAQAGGGWAVRSWLKPFANWIWGGCILMALGGALSLSDRRHRVAAGARKAVAVPAQ